MDTTTVRTNYSKKEAVARVKRINQTWIVRGGLAETTETYLKALEDSRDRRLWVSCRLVLVTTQIAHIDRRWNLEDPKSYFYPALFYLTSPLERHIYLERHVFTRAVVNALHRGRASRWKKCHLRDEVAEETQTKLYMVVGLIKRGIELLPELRQHYNEANMTVASELTYAL